MSIKRQKQVVAKPTKPERTTLADKREIDCDNVEMARSLLATNIGHLLAMAWLNGQKTGQDQR